MGTAGYFEDSMNSSEYLTQLLKDKSQLQAYPNVFLHVERVLDDEIRRVKGTVFSASGSEPMDLPEPLGPVITLHEKLIIPIKEFPDFNFIGRLLGPRGMTAKQLELETGCKILIRGQGSMRDKQKEEQMKGKSKWEHLNEELHVLITVEDSKNRAIIKLRRAIEEVQKLLVPMPECADELKKRQLIELAILNGTYRGLSGVFVTPVSAAEIGASALGPNFLGPPISVPAVATMGPMVLPLKSPDHHHHHQAGAPMFFAPAGMPVFSGALTPLPSPGAVTPVTAMPVAPLPVTQLSVTPLLSPCHSAPPSVLFSGEGGSGGGFLYQYEPCMIHSHSPTFYEQSMPTAQQTPINLTAGR